jgi:hypothetical protein
LTAKSCFTFWTRLKCCNRVTPSSLRVLVAPSSSCAYNRLSCTVRSPTSPFLRFALTQAIRARRPASYWHRHDRHGHSTSTSTGDCIPCRRASSKKPCRGSSHERPVKSNDIRVLAVIGTEKRRSRRRTSCQLVQLPCAAAYALHSILRPRKLLATSNRFQRSLLSNRSRGIAHWRLTARGHGVKLRSPDDVSGRHRRSRGTERRHDVERFRSERERASMCYREAVFDSPAD